MVALASVLVSLICYQILQIQVFENLQYEESKNLNIEKITFKIVQNEVLSNAFY